MSASDVFPRGFKTQAETIALEVGSEMNVEPDAPFDPRAYAAFLGIPLLGLSDLAQFGASKRSIHQLTVISPEEFSAATVFSGTARLIIENPRHSLGRRANSVAHEISHVLLEHEPGSVFGIGGCRRWSDSDEREADWLAGVLLIPRAAALRIVRNGIPSELAARQYGVSRALMNWRINHSGARMQAIRERQARDRRRSA